MKSQIKNIVFDIGNVLVKWDPKSVLLEVFDLKEEKQAEEWLIKLRPTWLDLNLGNLKESEAAEIFIKLTNKNKETIEELLNKLKTSQSVLEDSVKILNNLNSQNYALYSITDNVREIIEYYNTDSRYDFLKLFKAIITSCDVGVLKPNPEIYNKLISTYSLNPEESVFFDDLKVNVEGAQSVGMNAFQFTSAEKCIEDLGTLGVVVEID